MRWPRAFVVTALLVTACGGGGTVTDTTPIKITAAAVPTTADLERREGEHEH